MTRKQKRRAAFEASIDRSTRNGLSSDTERSVQVKRITSKTLDWDTYKGSKTPRP